MSAALDRRGDGAGDARRAGAGRCPPPSPASRSTAARIAPGEAFFAITGDNRDGHEFVAAALAAGAGLAVVAADKRAAIPATAPLLVVPDVLDALARSGARGARALAGQDRRRHRLGRQDQHQGGAAPGACGRRRDARLGRLLQQSLGRAAVARALPADGALSRVFEIGMNHAGEIDAADAAGAPACGDHHHGRAGASRILRLARGDRRRQGGNLPRARARRRRGDQPRQSAIRAPAARTPEPPASRASSRSASTPKADARLIKSVAAARLLHRAGAHSRRRRHLQARRAGPPPGAQFARRAGGGRARRRRSRAGGARAGAACSRRPAAARASRSIRRDGTALLIDESYNANPTSMRAALALLGQAADRRAAGASRCSATCWSWASRAPSCIAQLLEPVLANGVDLVFCCGPLMQALWEALPSERRGGYAETSARARAAGARRHPRRATPSWSRARSARGWGRSSRRSSAAIPAREASAAAPCARLIPCSIG